MQRQLFLGMGVIVLCLGVWNHHLWGEKIGELPDILKPASIVVYQGKGYIIEANRIHIVSLKNGKLIKSFGNQGEGPGEFKGRPKIKVYPDFLVLNSWGKIMFFSHDGKFLREQKNQLGHHPGALPIKNFYVGQKSTFSQKDGSANQTFGIYDKNFKLLKTLHQGPNPGQIMITSGQGKRPFAMVSEYIAFDVAGDMIFVSDSRKGLFFKVFDSSGSLLRTILVPTSPQKVTAAYKKKALAEMAAKSWWNQLKTRLKPVFPENFPEIRHVTIVKQKLYVLTYHEKGADCLLKIFDLKGKPLGQKYVPLAMNSRTPMYDIDNDSYYYLKENEESETWELFVEKLNQ